MSLDIVDDIKSLAKREGISVEKLKRLAANGRIIIPKNVKSKRKVNLYLFGASVEPKILTNVGSSESKPDESYVLECAKMALNAGSHGIYDCSVAGDLTSIRKKLLSNIPIPFGTNFIYQTAVESKTKHGSFLDMTEDDMIKTIEDHAKEGVDMATIFVPSLKMMKHLEKDKRFLYVVSRGAGILLKWMKHHQKENPLLTHFDSILDIAEEYNLTINLNDGMRPGCVFDTFDSAYLEGLIVTRELVNKTLERKLQVFIDGPGHMSLDEIDLAVRLTKKVCKGIPIAMLGPLATDYGLGLHHISAAIGGARAVEAGADLLYSITPAEHLGIPTPEEVRKGVLASAIAINAGFLSRESKFGEELKSSITKKRREEGKLYEYMMCSIARKILEGNVKKGYLKQCTVCGSYCPIKLLRE